LFGITDNTKYTKCREC